MFLTNSQKLDNAPRVIHHLDTDTTNRMMRANKKTSEYLHHLSNEPSIGLFHVCDHIARTIPKSVETKKALKNTTKTVEELNYDMDITIRTVKNMHDLDDTFKNIKTLINSSMYSIDMINKKIPPRPKQPPERIPLNVKSTEAEGIVSTTPTSPNDSSSSSHSSLEPSPSDSQGLLGPTTTTGRTNKKKRKTKTTQKQEFAPKMFQ